MVVADCSRPRSLGLPVGMVSRVRLWSRWGRAWTSRAAEVAEAVRRLRVTNVVLDGELLCPHEDGHSDFLQSTKRCRDLSPGRSDKWLKVKNPAFERRA